MIYKSMTLNLLPLPSKRRSSELVIESSVEWSFLKRDRPLQLYDIFSVEKFTVLKWPVVSRKSVANVESIVTQ